MQDFKQIKPEELSENVFDLIGRQWMLVTAGNREGFNTMTASWGSLGILWGAPTAFSFVRPQRYTNVFMKKSDVYTLSFYDEAYRSALQFCGTKSGRDYDKPAETGLSPVFDGGAVYFNEAKLVLLCRKIYVSAFSPKHFLSPDIEKNYPDKDYHDLYIGKIEKVLIK